MEARRGVVEKYENMAASSSKHVDAEELIDILLLDPDKSLPIIKEANSKCNLNDNEDFCSSFVPFCSVKLLENDLSEWGKCLKEMPLFTIKDIEEHRLNSGKTRDTAIIKTLDRGRKFKEERYISADSIYTRYDEKLFCFKAVCKASMKKEKRNILVQLDRTTGNVHHAECSCPAGQSGYCNHVMALLLEVADYSLNQLQNVPEEVACTSRSRQWGIPTESSMKAPVMSTVVQKKPTKKGIQCTIYDPKRIEKPENVRLHVKELQQSLQKLDSKKTSFPSAIYNNKNSKVVTNSYGEFDCLSPLAYQLNPVGFTHEIVSDLTKLASYNQSFEQDFISLPLQIINKESNVVPVWNLNANQKSYIKSITVTEKSCKALEYDTTNQSNSKLWWYVQKRKITSSNAHKVYIRKKQFQSIVPDFLSDVKEKPNTVKEALKHEQLCNSVVMEFYENVLRFNMHRDVDCRPAGCIIQPSLPWIVATPYAFISDRSKSGCRFGIIDICCPYRKRNSSAKELLSDKSFCVTKENGKLILKKDHHDGFYTRIQLEMGLCGASFGDFLVYTFHCLIVVRIKFDEDFFADVLCKLNDFYVDFLLPSIMEKMPLSEEEELSS